MFEVGERAEMEYNQNGHNLTIGKRCLAISAANAGRGYELPFGYFRIKFLAEFIYYTENIRNFVLGNHRTLFF